MRSAFLLNLFAILLISYPAFSQTIQKVKCTQSVFVTEPLTFFKEKSVLKTLSKRKDLVVGHPSVNGFEVYGDENLFNILDSLNVSYEIINFTKQDTLKSLGHPSHNQITEKLNELAEKFSNIMTLESLGESVRGRDLWMMKIGTDSEEKQHVLYIANMHGNEITGRELMVMMIEDLGVGYTNEDFEALNLLDQVVLHIMPSMNPDGADDRRRANANWVDLNRDFPDWTRGNSNTPEGREPEVKAVMEYYKRYSFTLSANFHGGAEVVNYPWDNSPDEGEQEQFLKQMSIDYISNGADYMKSSSFPEGIIRGYDWYPVYGGLQDWSTHYHQSPHITIELSNNKWPHFDEMSYFYENNRSSLFKMPLSKSSTRAHVSHRKHVH